MSQTLWHALSREEVVKTLKTSPAFGLKTKDISARRTKYGLNQLDDIPPTPWWVKLGAELNDYLIYILIAGGLLSLAMGEKIDGALILIIIGIMAGMGYVQNSKAESALAGLRKLVINKTTVVRDGEKVSIEFSDLVPGDLVTLRAGDIIPADIRIIEEHNASIDESTLTGESMTVSKFIRPVEKLVALGERKSMAYSGTELVSGRLDGIVVEIGMQTELGKIATLLSVTNTERSPLEIQLDRLGKTIGSTLLGLVAVVFALNLWRGATFLSASLEAVALAVAAVPEGLPAVITICLAFGTREMVKKNALVRKLKAVEALGSVSIVATDKTGTLTGGFMTVTDVWDIHKDVSKLYQITKLCNNNSDMTEIALLKWVNESAVDIDPLKRLQEHEFNSLLKRMSTVHLISKNEYLVAVKGAPEIILEHCKLDEKTHKKITTELLRMTGQGLRVLAFARKITGKEVLKQEREDVEKDLEFMGLIGLSDPPKKEVKDALIATRAAGIRPVMITGDNPLTASAIAKQLGFLDSTPLEGKDIDKLIEIGDLTAITSHSVFARVTPEHKSIIVKAFQDQGHYVAMIGDGVNDAPSIKLANVGVSMGIRGSDVTKGAADLVLLDDNYATLVTAVGEGRAILNRIRLFVSYLLSCNIAEVGIFIAASLMGSPFPLSPVMLLLLNIVTDAAPALAMAREPADKHLMSKPPRGSHDPIISIPMWANIAWLTVITTIVVTVAYKIGGRTMAFTTLSFLELLRAYTARSLTLHLKEIGVFSNPWITPSVVFGVIVTLIIVYVAGPALNIAPLPLSLLGMSVGLAMLGPIAEELFKPILRRLSGHS